MFSPNGFANVSVTLSTTLPALSLWHELPGTHSYKMYRSLMENGVIITINATSLSGDRQHDRGLLEETRYASYSW